MPNKVIDRIHALARRNRAANGNAFGLMDGTPILDYENDDNYMADPNYNPDHCNYEDDIMIPIRKMTSMMMMAPKIHNPLQE